MGMRPSGFIVQFALEKLFWGESRPDMAAYIIGVPISFIGVIAMVYCYHRYARCPACNHLPTNKTHNAVAIHLPHCPNCGAKLGGVVK
jgi:hypothetical protein